MHSSHLVAAVVAGLLVGVGVWIGATVWGGSAEPEPAIDVTRTAAIPPAPAPAPVSPPTLGGRDLDDVNQRVALLEQRLRELEEALADQAKDFEPMARLIEQAKEAGLLAEDGSPVMGGMPLGGVSEIAMGEDPGAGVGYARGLADTLGLDPSRKASLQAAVEEILTGIEVLEKENAAIEIDGDTTTIRIGTYDGSGLERDWQDWVSRNLSTDERAKLSKEHAANRLFGSRLGRHARTIQIEESGGTINVTESANRGEQDVMETQIQGPALARDLMLQPYAHLLE